MVSQRFMTANGISSGDIWNNAFLRLGAPAEFVWGALENYMEILAKRHGDDVTVALPWFTSSVMRVEQISNSSTHHRTKCCSQTVRLF